MVDDASSRVLEFYPRIFYACHTRHVTDEKTKVRLTANQASILDHLDEAEPVTLFDLAQHMGVTPSTMSIAVNRLVKLHLVRRDRNPDDSRRVSLLVSPAGARIKRAKSVLDPARVRSMIDRLSPEEKEAAIRGLGLLAYAAEMEMKSQSLRGAWSRRGARRKRKESS